jgi:FkbM family methyltransferase
MDTQRIKTLLIAMLGESLTARIQGLRFAYLRTTSPLADPEAGLIPRFSKQGDVTIDVGANGADWTRTLHLNVGATGHVFAFEADPYYALATRHAIRLMRMRGVHLFEFGLSDQEEELPLRILDAAKQRVSGLGYIDRNAGQGGGQATLVRLRTLDSLIPEHPELLRTSLFKCDVEGYELFVFRGARRILSEARPVVILEVGDFEQQGYSAREIHAFFKELHYDSFAMAGKEELVETDSLLDHDRAMSVNRVLIPAEKIGRVRDLVRPGTPPKAGSNATPERDDSRPARGRPGRADPAAPMQTGSTAEGNAAERGTAPGFRADSALGRR